MNARDVYFAVRHEIDHGGFPPFSGEQMSRLRDAADNALAEMEEEVQRAKFQSYNELRQRAEQAEAEVERLKCCGSCLHCGSVEYLNCTHDDVPVSLMGEFYVSLDDPCHFAPSRWTPREDR